MFDNVEAATATRAEPPTVRRRSSAPDGGHTDDGDGAFVRGRSTAHPLGFDAGGRKPESGAGRLSTLSRCAVPCVRHALRALARCGDIALAAPAGMPCAPGQSYLGVKGVRRPTGGVTHDRARHGSSVGGLVFDLRPSPAI